MAQYQWTIPVLWFATTVLSVAGQTSNVTQCITAYSWSINSLQQTPCLVAAYLESACGAPTDVPALPVDNQYLGPITSQADECRCSSVTYSMISACAGCQDRTYTDWFTWSQDCTPVFLTTFPELLPPVTTVVVPSWAFLNPTLTNNTFSAVAAQENASASASSSTSAITTSTSELTPTTSAITTSTSGLTPSPSTTASAGQSKSNAGAIAGGVVGGIAFLAIIALVVLWYSVLRQRNMVQQKVAFDSRALASGTATSQTATSLQGPSPASQSIYTSDRSIYPASPTSGVYTSGIPPSRRSLESVSLSLAQFGGGPQTYGNVQRGYTGIPEI